MFYSNLATSLDNIITRNFFRKFVETKLNYNLLAKFLHGFSTLDHFFSLIYVIGFRIFIAVFLYYY